MQNQQNGQLTYNNLPFEGKDFSWREVDRTKPVKKGRTFARTFLTTNEEHMKEYSAVYQKVVDGIARVGQELKEFDISIQGWRIFLLWCEFYYTKGDADAGQRQTPQG